MTGGVVSSGGTGLTSTGSSQGSEAGGGGGDTGGDSVTGTVTTAGNQGGTTANSTVGTTTTSSSNEGPVSPARQPIPNGKGDSPLEKAGGGAGTGPAVATGPHATQQLNIQQASSGGAGGGGAGGGNTREALESKVAAGLLSTVARLAGLEDTGSHVPVDEDLTGKPESINFDDSDAIVKRIIESANAAKGSEAAGVVRDFLSAAGIDIAKDKDIPEIKASQLSGKFKVDQKCWGPIFKIYSQRNHWPSDTNRS